MRPTMIDGVTGEEGAQQAQSLVVHVSPLMYVLHLAKSRELASTSIETEFLSLGSSFHARGDLALRPGAPRRADDDVRGV